MIRKIGVMQGRLSPPRGGRIQSFPHESWRIEFDLAATIELQSIEWIVESPLDENPFFDGNRLEEVRTASLKTGVSVDFVIADYFMESPFVRMSVPMQDSNTAVLKRLISHAASLKLRGVEIPFVDASEIINSTEEDEVVRSLTPCIEYAASLGILIGLETSLPPDRFRTLLNRFDDSVVFANYDIGNSASLGFNFKEEFDAYGKRIGNVHIKDRIRGGSTVPLGEGAADLPGVFRALQRIGYSGDLILQVARGATGKEVETVSGYLQQIQGLIKELP